MNILLDTHAFLWLTSDAPELSKKAKKLYADPHNDFLLSTASLWEMAIKLNLGKLSLQQPFEKFIPLQLKENAIVKLDITFRHITKIATLPRHHGDPFDRLLIAQALEEKLPILSCDTAFDDYPIKRLW
jgi:PIN domain nuclease of toxin-antitoxin system